MTQACVQLPRHPGQCSGRHFGSILCQPCLYILLHGGRQGLGAGDEDPILKPGQLLL